MLNQSFSEENFKKIIEIQNRKGVYLEGNFFPDIVEINKKLKTIKNKFKSLKSRGLSRELYNSEKKKLNEEKEKLKEEKNKILKEELTTISATVTSSNFKITITRDTNISSKPVYKTHHSLENILTLKQLQFNFKKLYKVKQANRYSIISQIKNLLDDGFPKVIIKTDVKDFYESIPQDKLLKHLSDENLLSPLSRKFIKQILLQYNILTGLQKGVPRGIGISAYLVELYMRQIDNMIKSLPGVLYYSRYVDDMIIIFLPPTDTKKINYKSKIKDILVANNLVMNEDPQKTKEIDITDKSKNINYNFDYLGYNFSSGYKDKKHIPLQVTISRKKKRRYASRLLKAFKLYNDSSKRNEKKARKVFIKRIRFLTNNTRLVNNKKNILTGIFYSNSLINNINDLKTLDRYFRFLLFKSTYPQQLKNRIAKNSFEMGFNASNLKKFTSTDLEIMIDGWIR